MNLKDFESAPFKDRTEAVPCPDLKEFFPKGATPEMIVRGLTACEIFRANEAASRTEQMVKIASGLVAGDAAAAAAILTALGLDESDSENTPAEYSRRLSWVVQASVKPKFTQQAAIKLAKNYPIVFTEMSTRILALTGLGRVPGKPKGSGATSESGPHSASGIETATSPTP